MITKARELSDLARCVFVRNGCDAANTDALARTVVTAERDGSFSHGLFRVQGYIASLRSGNVSGRASPSVEHDGIYRAMRRGESTHMRNRVDAVAAELMTAHWRIESGKATLLTTRMAVDRGWNAVSDPLAHQGQPVRFCELTRNFRRP